jgi:1-acyl-sn-glycerol-3-phosphate acyltransferase
MPIKGGHGVDQPALECYVDRLDTGKWLNIFPEGGTFQCDEFNCGRPYLRWGLGKVIATAKVTPTVVPAYHWGMPNVLPMKPDRSTNAQFFPNTGQQVKVRFGDPVPVQDLLEVYRRQKRAAAKAAGKEQLRDPLEQLREDWYVPVAKGSAEAQLYRDLTLRVEKALRAIEDDVQAEDLARVASGDSQWDGMVNLSPRLREQGLRKHTGTGLLLHGRPNGPADPGGY